MSGSRTTRKTRPKEAQPVGEETVSTTYNFTRANSCAETSWSKFEASPTSTSDAEASARRRLASSDRGAARGPGIGVLRGGRL